MQRKSAPASPRWTHLIQVIRRRIFSEDFLSRHRKSPKYFTRQRVLPFATVVLLLLQKTTKSVQRHLNELLAALWPQEEVGATDGAWTQARAKLGHGAFTELNQDVLLPEFYAPAHAAYRRTWKGHRLLGGDGSDLRLPSHPGIVESFPELNVTNQHGHTGTHYSPARLSVLYDLLNHIGLDARLGPMKQSEVDLLAEQLEHVQPNDILVWDRGFTGFVLMAQTRALGAHFIGRCSTASFGTAQELFRINRAGRSKTVKIFAAPQNRARLKELGLPTELIVRFVSLRLPSGELEVLVTSLLDEEVYPTQEFLQVYDCRWNHETYHLMLKGRLDLENWTGQTEEAVRQDVQAAVLVSNLETLLSQEVQEELSAGDARRKHPAQVNRSNSYHALKTHIVDLLWSKSPVEGAIRCIQRWMRTKPVSVNSDRKPPPRKRTSPRRSYQYQRNLKKNVF